MPAKEMKSIMMAAEYSVLNVNRMVFFTSIILFRGLLDFSYINYVSELFSYDGFFYEFDGWQYVVSWMLFLISLTIVSDRILKVSHYFFATAMLSVIAPLTSLCGLDSERPLLPVVVSITALLWVCFLSRLAVINFNGLPPVRHGRQLAVLLATCFVLFLVLWFYTSGAKPNLDIREVYDFRQANADVAAQGLFAYTNNWTYQIFSVYLMCMALYARRFLVFLLLLGIQIYFFAFAAHKSILFLPFLVLSVWFYFRYSDSLLMLPLLFIGILLISIIANVFWGDVWLISMVARRVFFVPADLTFSYFDFFSQHAHSYWSNSILSAFFTYPYGDVGIPYVIGDFLGKPEMGANNGFVSSGYAHAGVFGVFVYATILGILLGLLNGISSGFMPVWLAVAISIVPLRSLLISSDLFTVMLTHGFAVAMCLMYLSRKRSLMAH